MPYLHLRSHSLHAAHYQYPELFLKHSKIFLDSCEPAAFKSPVPLFHLTH